MPGWVTVPDWLAEVARSTAVPLPWGTMLRAVIAIWVPLALGIATGNRSLASLPAMGGLMSVMVDQGGPYLTRVRRVAVAGLAGGATGLLIGSLIHGRGWIAVGALVVVAGVSAILARLGAIGSVTGLQLLVYTALSGGPLGALRPWWHTALEFIAGVAWALVLLVPGWLISPRSVERRLVADVYHDLAAGLRAIGTPEAGAARRTLTAALNAAYDALVRGRSAASGRSRPSMHLIAILNASHPMTEAATALRAAHERPPPWVTDTIDRLADVIASHPKADSLPLIPPQWSASHGALALRESMVSLSRVISGKWTPPPVTPEPWLARLRRWADHAWEELAGGTIAWQFTIRLMACTGVATVLSDVLPLERSYWVPLTVAVILKPDYGSVFARALQRAIGTVLGAVLGAAILAMVPFGPWLLIPFGILAALLPYGKARNFGLSAVFLTPLVVLLIDLQNPGGWPLAADRALDTLLASAVVLLIGYAPWPASWHAHLPAKLAATLRVISDYMDESLVTAWMPEAATPGAASPQGGPASAERPAQRSRLRRRSSRALSDLRAEYQRTMSEPRAVSRRASVLWPAVVALEDLMDVVTTTALQISRGAPAPGGPAVRQLTGELRAIAEAMDAGLVLPATSRMLPADEALEPVTAAVRSVLGVLTPSQSQPPELASEPGLQPDDAQVRHAVVVVVLGSDRDPARDGRGGDPAVVDG